MYIYMYIYIIIYIYMYIYIRRNSPITMGLTLCHCPAKKHAIASMTC